MCINSIVVILLRHCCITLIVVGFSLARVSGVDLLLVPSIVSQGLASFVSIVIRLIHFQSLSVALALSFDCFPYNNHVVQ